ncbi:MAG: SGNH/GDSL hydrolase family protein [Planctomycetaceae bacterium]
MPARKFLALSVLFIVLLGSLHTQVQGQESKWAYRAELLRPFWEGEVTEGESVLFIKEGPDGEGRASVLFPIQEVLTVRNSAGDVTYENGKDYVWKPDSREIVLPPGSRIPAHSTQDLRRPAKSQQYQLTHRDGKGEIMFGGRLEYAEMQTCITYRHAAGQWTGKLPKFDENVLSRSIHKLQNKEPLSIVVLGDSISAGANASGMYDAAPYQPAYPELLKIHLEKQSGAPVTLANPSVGGMSAPWGVTQVDTVLKSNPDLVVIAFGMNDSSGRSPADYQDAIKQTINKIREKKPECEFILVASMLGNHNWVTLKNELFGQYRNKLNELTSPSVALADLTSVWEKFLRLKQDWDQTGNGVNHPNDFGHRVYAQVISALLLPPPQPAEKK